MLNIEELFPTKVRFRDSLFFGLVICFFLSWAYRLGAGEQATFISWLVMAGFMLAILGYSAYIYYAFSREYHTANRNYEAYLKQHTPNELQRHLNQPTITARSKRLIIAYLAK